MQDIHKCLCCGAPRGRPRILSGFDDFQERALSYSLQLYRNTLQGSLIIQLAKGTSHPHWAIVLITEHRPFESRQHTLRFDDGDAVATHLPAGDYTVVVTAKGYEPYRAFVTLHPDKVSTINAQLQEEQSKGPTFDEVLARNLIQRDRKSLRNLTVAAGSTLVLDPASQELSMDRETVRLRTLADVKRILGCPDSAFVGEHPRFGRFSPAYPSTAEVVPGALSLAQRAAFNEYVYGNSKSVAGWERPLDKWIADELLTAILWVFTDIDVGPHSVLVVTSNGLLCNKLSVHYTGQVRLQGPGPIKVEMNHYVRYGMHLSPTVAGATAVG